MERMAGEEKPERLLFVEQLFALAPALGGDILRRMRFGIVAAVKQAVLHDIALSLVCRLDRDTHGSKQLGPVIIDRIERAGPNQRFYHAAIGDALVDPQTEIEQALERAAGFARLDDHG